MINLVIGWINSSVTHIPILRWLAGIGTKRWQFVFDNTQLNEPLAVATNSNYS